MATRGAITMLKNSEALQQIIQMATIDPEPIGFVPTKLPENTQWNQQNTKYVLTNCNWSGPKTIFLTFPRFQSEVRPTYQRFEEFEQQSSNFTSREDDPWLEDQ